MKVQPAEICIIPDLGRCNRREREHAKPEARSEEKREEQS